MSRSEDIWEAFVATHRVGDRLDARVTKVVPFGAFVEVADGVEGLLVVEDAANLGATVTVRIKEIDTVKRRLAFQSA
jgi:small subunit ribosomal protein S1